DALAESIASPSCEPTSSGATTTGWAIATRVTLTAVPRTVNSQMGAVDGPREVWIGPDVSRAAVTRSISQSEQGAAVVDSIATMASCAERRGTFVVVPSCHATSPSGGASSDSGSTDATIPAMSARLLLSP